MCGVLISKVEEGGILEPQEAEAVMEKLLSGRVPTEEIVRLLTALNRRTVQKHELAGFARVMRKHATPVFAVGEQKPERMVDTCGTGGDSSGTFNISTAAAIVAAAAGARVAKHGNRAASSQSGSADVLEALGVRMDLPFERYGKAVREIGIGFFFAPVAHAAARHAAPARKQIGARTVFNLLGPLTNPAGAQVQVVGVYSPDVMELVANTLAELGEERALVVHGAGGLDEISIAGETRVTELLNGMVRSFQVTPEQFGVPRSTLAAIRGGSAEENAGTIRAILRGEIGAGRDVVVINAAAAIVVAGVVMDFRVGAELAAKAIDSGAAAKKLDELIAFTRKN
jgi:anthranilate phosphoribosyltransferase